MCVGFKNSLGTRRRTREKPRHTPVFVSSPADDCVEPFCSAPACYSEQFIRCTSPEPLKASIAEYCLVGSCSLQLQNIQSAFRFGGILAKLRLVEALERWPFHDPRSLSTIDHLTRQMARDADNNSRGQPPRLQDLGLTWREPESCKSIFCDPLDLFLNFLTKRPKDRIDLI